MSSCFRIQVLPKGKMPRHFMSKDGNYYLDLVEGEELIEVKRRSKLDINFQIGVNGAYEIDLPETPKNRFFFQNLISIHSEFSNSIYLEVQSYVGPVPQNFNHLFIRKKTDASGNYSGLITNKIDHPIALAANLKMKDIFYKTFHFDFGGQSFTKKDPMKFTLDNDEVEQRFDTHYKFEDEHEGYFIFPVWYGQTNEPGVMKGNDNRPWISPLKLMRLGMKAIGYSFKSDILESDEWRQTWLYWSGENYGSNFDYDAEDYDVYGLARDTNFASITDQYNLIQLEPLKVGKTNGQNQFYDGSYVRKSITNRALKCDVIIDYKFITTKSENPEPIIISVFDSNGTIATEEIHITNVQSVYSGTIAAISNFGKEMNYFSDIIGMRLMQGNKFTSIDYIKLRVDNVEFSYHSTSYLNFKIEYELNEIFERNDTFLDAWKEVLFMLDGENSFDLINNEVEIIPSKEKDKFRSVHNLSPNVICDSRTISQKENSSARYLAVGFKKSNDKQIRDSNKNNNEIQIYDRVIDFGSDYEDKYASHRARLIEPTINIPVSEVVGLESKGLPPLLPKVTFESKRILRVTKPTRHFHLDDNGDRLQAVKLNWNGKEIDKFPFGFQVVGNDTLVEGHIDYPLSFESIHNNLFDKFYSLKSIVLLNTKSKYELQLPLSDFDLIRENDEVEISYKEDYISSVFEAIKYNYCTGFAELEMPSVNELDLCLSDSSIIQTQDDNPEEPEAEICSGSGIPVFVELFGCHFLSIGGTWNSPIQEFIFESNYEFEQVSLSTIKVCNAGPDLEVSVQVVKEDGCPTETYNFDFNPCDVSVTPDLITKSKTDGELCAYVSLEIDEPEKVLSIEAEIEIDGVRSPYEIDLESLQGPSICGIDDYVELVSLVVNFKNLSCPSWELPEEIRAELKTNTPVETKKIKCGETDAYITIEQLPNGCYTINKHGNIGFPDFIEKIWIRDDLGTRIWDGNDICQSGFEAMYELEDASCKCGCYKFGWVELNKDCECSDIISSDIVIRCKDCQIIPSLNSCELSDEMTYSWYNSNSEIVSNNRILDNPPSGDYFLKLEISDCEKLSRIITYVQPNAGEGGYLVSN